MKLNKIYCGDCVEVMKTFVNNSIDAIVTDPPYGLKFMGKQWDHGIPGVPYWQAALRVLKPGGHLLSFGGTRTYHRMVCAIEDAGFEIRDCIMWLYGSGFPKNLNIGKAADKLDTIDMRRERNLSFTAWMRSTGITIKEIDELTSSNMGMHYLTNKEQPAVPTKDMFSKLRDRLPQPPAYIEKLIYDRTVKSKKFAEREIIRKDRNWGEKGDVPISAYGKFNITKGTSVWECWGTALKPAFEPIVVARKPLSEKNVAENVLKWGTGGINIDGCRVGTEIIPTRKRGNAVNTNFMSGGITLEHQGRFPANLILECICDEVREGKEIGNGAFPQKHGSSIFTSEKERKKRINIKDKALIHTNPECPCYMLNKQTRNDSGGASRFFYVAKASKSERNAGCEIYWLDGKEIDKEVYQKLELENEEHKDDKEWKRHAIGKNNIHTTVKPITLMSYLIKLVTPPGGTVLDPFTGSGSTLVAAKKLGFNFIGIEKENEYIIIATARLAAAKLQ